MTTERPAENALGVFNNVRNIAAVLGGIGGAGLVIALFSDLKAFWAAYFFGYVFWLILTVGCLTLTTLHHVIRGAWGVAILRILEAGNKNLPIMAALFIPLAIAMWRHDLYIWANPAEVAKSALLQHKALYLNPVAWSIRAGLFWIFWIGLSLFLNAKSDEQDRTGNEALAQLRTNVAAPMGVVLVCVITFAATDWIMSLDPAWFSTIYGVWFMISGVLAALAMSVLILTGLADRRPYNEVVTPALTKDLGNLMFGFTMFWTYVSLSQFLIIWSGNLPEEITFYINRFNGPLVYLGAFIIFGQFFAPFTALLSGKAKREPKLLFKIAAWILTMRLIDVFWQITPFFKTELTMANFGAYALDLGAFAFVGGVWVWGFVHNLKKNPLLPRHDTRLQERVISMLEGGHH
jgi:hypothetical protein